MRQYTFRIQGMPIGCKPQNHIANSSQGVLLSHIKTADIELNDGYSPSAIQYGFGKQILDLPMSRPESTLCSHGISLPIADCEARGQSSIYGSAIGCKGTPSVNTRHTLPRPLLRIFQRAIYINPHVLLQLDLQILVKRLMRFRYSETYQRKSMSLQVKQIEEQNEYSCG